MQSNRLNWKPTLSPAPGEFPRPLPAVGGVVEPTQELGQGDEWTPLPAADARCPVSFWPRGKIIGLVGQEKIRAKTAEGSSFYALSDVRALLKFVAGQN